MKSLILLTPEIILSVTALGLLLWDAFKPSHRRGFAFVSVAAVLLSIAYLVPFFFSQTLPWLDAFGIVPTSSHGNWVQFSAVGGMLTVDSLSIFFKGAILSSILLIVWISMDYYEFKDVPMGTYFGLLLLATVGLLLLVGSTDFLMAVIALELISIPSFILTGYILGRRSSAEGAIKFFLVGTFSTGILLFGLSYYYGYFGTTTIDPLLLFSATGARPDMPLSLILVFLVAGLGFKLAMVPFHMWAPDAYEGAPTPVTAFLSVAPKAAVVGFVLRIFSQHAALNLTPVLAVLAAVTMTVGNLGALHQTNVKRLLAYSSVAQVGYILVAIVAGGSYGSQATMMYTVFYLFMNLGVFAVLMMVSQETHSDDITSFAGLSKRSLGLAMALVIFLLSLTGIPPLAGFIGKFSIFAAVINTPGLLWLGIVAVLNSVISLYYYFKLAYQAFFQESREDSFRLATTPALMSCLVLALIVTVALGLFPNGLLKWVNGVVGL